MNIFRKFKIRNRYIRSMRFIILVLTILVGVVPLMLGNAFYLKMIEDKMIEQKMERLLGQCNILRNHIVSERYMENQEVPSVKAELSQLSAMYEGRVLITDRDFRIIEDSYQMDNNKICISESVLKSFQGETVSFYKSSEQFIEIAFPIVSGKDILGSMLVTFSTYDVKEVLKEIASASMLVDVILILIIVVGAVYISKLLVKPFRDIESSIESVNNGYLDQTIDVDGYTETLRISEVFNELLARIKKVDDSRQEFVSNVSHELKTPMTSIKVLADSLVMQDNVPVELYKEFMTDIVAEIDRENEIISDLLTLVKMDKKSTDLNISEININEMVELILKRLRPIAAKRNIELVLESFRPVIAQVDEVKLTSAISNLVENAIKYNVLDGWVHVTLNADHKYFYVKVEDSGIGIPEESQEMIFERFYRVDKTRSRETGGTGLGLAITKNIIQMHRGVIKVYSKENEGTTFTVRIPLNYIKVVKISRENLARKKTFQSGD